MAPGISRAPGGRAPRRARSGVYQEFARGYGVKEYQGLLESGEANRTRLKTPSEFKRAELANTGFGATITRQVLFAVGRVAEQDEVKDGMTWLRAEVPGYWDPAIVPSRLSGPSRHRSLGAGCRRAAFARRRQL